MAKKKKTKHAKSPSAQHAHALSVAAPRPSALLLKEKH